MGASFCYRCMAKLDKEVSICPKCRGLIPYIPNDSRDIAPGALLHSRFIMGRSIGRGGFGATYLAYDLEERCVCAVKEFFPDKMCERAEDQVSVHPLPEDERRYMGYKSSFIDEARRLFNLAAHPGVVNVIEQFEENNTAYFAMEYISGQTLKEYMRGNARGLPPREAMRIIAEMLHALALVHGAGMLHRDISADNIMRTERGKIKLIDFGSARETRQESKTIFTKGIYTAPEQKLGDKQRACTDIYAVGVVMFLLLVGRTPTMTGGHPESLRTAKKGLNEETYRVYEAATAINPNFRYQKAEDMLCDLEKVAHSLPKGRKARRGGGKKKGLLLLLLVLLLLILLLIIVAYC